MLTPTSAAELAEPVAIIYRDAELRILAALAGKLAQGIDLTDWEARQLTELQNVRAQVLTILAETNAEAAAAIDRAIAWAYSGGELSALVDLNAELPAGVGLAPRPEVVALAADTVAAVASTAPAILRGVDDAYRSIIRQAAADVAAGSLGRREATQRAINTFLGEGLTFVPTKRGNWDIATYAEMATRTATARSSIQGHLDTMGSMGLDLVVIHPGPRACRICDQWARMILTTGTATGVQQLDNAAAPGTVSIDVGGTLDDAKAAGWGHPNCRCGMRSFIPGVTDVSLIERPEWDAVGYEAQQKQRGIERQIRAWKRREALAITGDDRADARRQVRAYQEAQRQHLVKHPTLKRQSEREQIGGRFSGNAGQARRRAGSTPPRETSKATQRATRPAPAKPAPNAKPTRPAAPAAAPATSSAEVAAPRQTPPSEPRAPRPDPRGKDARTMTNAERLEAARIMFGTDSPEYRAALKRWG